MNTSKNDKREIWETYASAWRVPTPDAKRAALVASVDPASTYRDPLTQRRGHDDLVDAMLEFHAQIPGGHFQTTYFLAYEDRSIARWNMLSADGSVLGEGISYGEYGADGKLTTMTGFFETP